MALQKTIKPANNYYNPKDKIYIKKKKHHLAVKQFDEYSRNSTIHGFRYIGGNRSASEKCFWLIVFLVSCITCSIMCFHLWIRWDTNPVVLTFDEVITDVSQIPFPAVTICPSSKVNKSVVDIVENFKNLQLGKKLSDVQLQKMKALYHICDDDTGLADNFDLFLDKFEMDDDGYNVPSILKNITLTGQQISESEFKYCSKTKTSDVFTKTLTEDGVCLTFNIVDFDDLFHNRTVHDKYESGRITTNNSWDHPYPIYVLGASKSYGLVTGLSSLSQNVEFICNGLDQGYKIILHSPYEFPETKSRYFQIPYNYKAVIMIKPVITNKVDGLETLSLNKRQCYLEGEKELYFFKKYTKRNCELECLTNMTRRMCGCVSFYMPRESHTKICGTSKIQCYRNVTRISAQHDPVKCNCLPSCTSIVYDAEMHEFVYDIENYLQIYDSLLANISDEIIDEPLTELRGMQYNRISIFFKDANFIAMKRAVLYGWSDFFANVGGLLGLFMGISIVSFVEIFYFCCSGILAAVFKPKVWDQNNL